MTGKRRTYFTIAAFALVILGAVIRHQAYSEFGPIDYAVTEMKIVPLNFSIYSAVQPEDIALLKDILRQDFPSAKVSIGYPMNVPKDAYNDKTQQLDINKLLKELLKKPEEKSVRVIGITAMDLTDYKLNFLFSGVWLGKNALVMSYRRLKTDNPNLNRDRYRKILLRALGFTFGFKSLSDRTCVMAFSNSLQELDEKGAKWCGEEAEEIKKISPEATPHGKNI